MSGLLHVEESLAKGTRLRGTACTLYGLGTACTGLRASLSPSARTLREWRLPVCTPTPPSHLCRLPCANVPPSGVKRCSNNHDPHPCGLQTEPLHFKQPACAPVGNTPVGVLHMSTLSWLSTYARPHPCGVYPPLSPLLRLLLSELPLPTVYLPR